MKNPDKRNKIKKVADILREEISDVHLPHGHRISSASSIARKLGVSTPTVHAAEKLLVQEGLLYRIQGSGTYINRGEHSGHYTIGLLESDAVGPVSDSMREVFRSQIRNITRHLHDYGYAVQQFSYQELLDEKTALEKLKYLDGFLLSCCYVDHQTLDLLKKSQKPFVIFRNLTELPLPASQICIDLLPGMREALSTATGSELKSPVIFCESHSWPIAKLWKQVLMEHGIAEENINILEMNTLFLANECYRYVRVHGKQLAHTMFFTAQDGIAANLISALALEGLHPGEDFRIVSCENREGQGFRFQPEPAIASVYAPEDKIMNEAAKLLRQLIDHPTDCTHIVKLPSQLAVRKSIFLKGQKLLSETDKITQ